jgi:hypothetical protein
LGLSTIISFTIAPSSEGLLLIVVGMKFGWCLPRPLAIH